MSKRLFIGVSIPDDVRQAVARHIEDLRSSIRNVRVGWERPEKLHFTLKFLGDTPAERIPHIDRGLCEASAGNTAFEASISGTGVFPNERGPRILWLGMGAGAAELTRLAGSVDEELSAVAFPTEDRSFKPHLTIARLREPAVAQGVVRKHLSTAFAPISFHISAITLYESIAGAQGSTYRTIAEHAFYALTSR